MYTITHSTPEVIPNLLYVIVPIPLPLSAILILVIDLGFELIAALQFAWDPPESTEGLMKLQPRKPVNATTIDIYRRSALRKSRARYDEESGTVIHPEDETWFQKAAHQVKDVFNKEFWTEKFSHNKGSEILVDGPLLSWAYLEIGTIEAIGALVTFFVVLHSRGINPHDARIMQKGSGAPTKYWTKDGQTYKGIDGHTQADILAEAQSSYYMAIFIMQCFNIFACKTRFSFPVGRYMFSNRVTFYSIIGGAALACFIIYTPGVEVVFKTSRSLVPLYWLIPMAFGFFLIGYSSLRMLVMRRLKPVKWNPEITGLQMYPTIWTARTMSTSRSI
jgi:sodium/potassium-transporting ATPase subunit alpha